MFFNWLYFASFLYFPLFFCFLLCIVLLSSGMISHTQWGGFNFEFLIVIQLVVLFLFLVLSIILLFPSLYCTVVTRHDQSHSVRAAFSRKKVVSRKPLALNYSSYAILNLFFLDILSFGRNCWPFAFFSLT